MQFVDYLTNVVGLASSTANLYSSSWKNQKTETTAQRRTLTTARKHWQRYCNGKYDRSEANEHDVNDVEISEGETSKEKIRRPLQFQDVFPSLVSGGEAAKTLRNIIEVLKIKNFDDEIKILFITTIVNNHNKE